MAIELVQVGSAIPSLTQGLHDNVRGRGNSDFKFILTGVNVAVGLTEVHFWFGLGVRVQCPLPGLRRGFDRIKEEREEAGRLAGQSYRTFNPRPGTNFPSLIDGKVMS